LAERREIEREDIDASRGTRQAARGTHWQELVDGWRYIGASPLLLSESLAAGRRFRRGLALDSIAGW
jgi:hypothetical protein